MSIINKILVFTATYNESENILKFINQVFNASDQIDLLIVDDNSPDKTFEIIASHPLINKKITYIIIDSNSVFFSFLKIKKIILSNNFSKKKVFFSMQYFVNVSALFFLKEIKDLKVFIYEINHPTELDFSQNITEFLKKKIIKLLVKKLYDRANIVAANSEELGQDLSFLIDKKVEIILNPFFNKITLSKKKKIKKKIKILNISRFEYQKDHLTLLKGIN